MAEMKICPRCGKEFDEPFQNCAKCRLKATNAQKALIQRRKEKGLCVRCGRPRDNSTQSCTACMTKMKKYKREEYSYLKANRICPYCRKESLYLNEWACPSCIERKKKHADKSREYNLKMYWKRRDNNLCTGCGTPTGGSRLCPKCKDKELIKVRRRHAREKEGKIQRSEWVSYGLCYKCGKPLDRKGGMCKSCYEKNSINNVRRVPQGDKAKHPWKQMNDALFKNILP